MSLKYFEDLAFNANLQEFARWVSYVCELEARGKISSEKAYQEVKVLWEELIATKEGLRLSGNFSLPIEDNQ